jgi:hypothetical protein
MQEVMGRFVAVALLVALLFAAAICLGLGVLLAGLLRAFGKNESIGTVAALPWGVDRRHPWSACYENVGQ